MPGIRSYLKKKMTVDMIFNSADRMLVLGEYWKKQMATIVNPDKIEILYNGAECPRENPYNVDGKCILYMGLLNRTKGTYDLVDAIELINNELPSEIKVYLCGVDEKGDVTRYVLEKALQDRFFMPGWINKNTRLELFKNTLICVLPSYYEGLSMTVIEAMCYGIPMVTTNISTMPELLGDEIEKIEPGDIRKLAELIIELVTNRELRFKNSKIEYERARDKFSQDIIMKRTIDIYREVNKMN